ncbi:MAG: VWA domain-containing protein, partial [Chloroflexi bacterium]|nr:VWA domain-containing protein [Chloroflexota bacterium]
QRPRGRYIRARRPRGRVHDLALDATLRAAAARGPQTRPLRLHKDDLREKVRITQQAYLVLFVVDGSWSMAVAQRMEAAKGAVLRLLTEAYQRRDWVAMITFRRDDATVVLPPTRSVALARHALADLPVGGKTPLAAGLQRTLEVIQRQRLAYPDVQPFVVLLTDGAGNVPLVPGHDPLDDAYRMAARLAQQDIQGLVINLEHPQFDRGLAQTLAHYLGLPCYRLPHVETDALVQAVRHGLGRPRGRTE